MRGIAGSEVITVRVTRADIRRGLKHVIDRCPVALAVARAFCVDKPEVYAGRVSLDGKHREHRKLGLPLPKRAEAFIDRFDNGKPVKPFAFRLFVPLNLLPDPEPER